MRTPFRRGGLSLFLLLALAPAASAWIADGSLVCGAAGDQRAPVAVSDGLGGAIVVWEDRRGGEGDVYAQRLGPNGSPLWTADGVAVCDAAGEQITPAVIPDGSGGAVIVWEDLRVPGNSEIYAQRLDALGTARWTANGVAACAAPGLQTTPVLATDGAGGAIVAWSDSRGATADVYAQRIDALGVTRWTLNGVALAVAPGDQTNPAIAADGSGGAIVAWADVTVQAQRVDASGALAWGLGVPVSVTSGFEFSPSIVGDGAGGAIVAWTDMRAVFDQDVYAQRLAPTGALLWGDSGQVVCATSGFQHTPVAMPDGAGGAVVVWRDVRGGVSTDLYAQRLGPAGARAWTADGVPLCVADGDQFSPALASMGGGAVIAAWHDGRSPSGNDVFARAITAGGGLEWIEGGALVCGASGDQQSVAIVADGVGGAIVIWDDGRGASGSDLFAARVAGDGVLVPVAIALVSAAAEPGRVRLVWHAPERGGVEATLERRTAATDWRALATAALDAAGNLAFEDAEVAPGTRYGYRLAVRQDGAIERTGETWIEVPAAPALALEGARPHPVERECLVSLALATPAPARLEWFDVRGRRVLARDLGALGAGRHLLKVDEARALPNGLYLLRLVQGEAHATAKVLVRR